MEQQERVSPGFHFLPAYTTTAESPSKIKIVQCNLAIVNYTINRRNRRVLNLVSVERFVLLVKRMEQAIARVLVIYPSLGLVKK
jgi:hypothetical protein